MFSINRFGCLLIVFGLFICGCSGASAPSSPPVSDDTSLDSGNPPLTGTGQGTDLDTTPQVAQENPGQVTNHWLWAYEQIYIDPGNMEFEVIPQRLVTGHWNVLTWLENGPCTDCFQLVGLTPSGTGTLLADIEVTHPFSLLNFTGFDVRGIAMFTGSKTFPVSGLTTPDRLAGDGELVNADGYTTLYNSTTEGSGPDGLQGYQKGNLASVTPPDAILNGYKRHITDDPANTRNAFYAGDSIIATYEVDMPDGPFIFGYAVDASWTKPLTTPVTDPMTEFGPDANCPEPWKIEITEEPVGQGLTDQGGETVLTIDVFDWQGKDSHYDPVLECPELFNGSANASWVEDGTGYARYEVTIQNQSLAGEGEYECLIKVEDTENAGSPDWLDLTSYQIYTLEVGEYQVEYYDPIAAAEADPVEQTICEPIHFYDSGSMDPDGGSIVTYEWDWDNDGVYDEVGDDVYHTWDVPGTYYVQFRVTDDEGATDELDDPLEIVTENALPTAIAIASKTEALLDEMIEFFADGSHDNDCGGQEIVEREWDWENDGTFDETGETANHSYSEAGVYFVQLRVTDNEGGADLLDDPLQITISIEKFDPIACAEADPNPQIVCEEVMLDGGCSYDPDGGEIALYEWDLDYDGTFDEFGKTIGHTWDNVGVYNVQLRVTDDESATDELDEPLEIVIENALPTAIAEASSYAVPVFGSIDFDGTNSHDNDCGDESIVLCEWDFDWDGSFNQDSEGEQVNHQWGNPGEYLVMLRVTDDEDEWAELADPIEITVTPDYMDPLAFAEAVPNPQTVCEPVNFHDAGSYDPDGGLIVTYEWDWENDGIYNESGSDVFHSWDEPGTYNVQFRVVDDEGAYGELVAPLEIMIENALPVAVALADKYDAPLGEWIQFDGTGSYDGDCGGADIVLYEWDFDYDGVFVSDADGPFVSYQYDAPGQYFFMLKVTDDEDDIGVLYEPEKITIWKTIPWVEITECLPEVEDVSHVFEWDMWDDHTPVEELMVNIWEDSDGPIMLPDGTNQYNWTDIGCGDHTFKVEVTNEFDETYSDTCDFSRTDFPPEVNVTNCPSTTGSSYTFNWDMSDDCTEYNLLAIEIRKDDGAWEPLPAGSVGYTWNGIACSGRTFEVRVTDGMGQSGTDICHFDGPDNPPEISVTNCPETTGSSYTFNWDMSDDCTEYSFLTVEIRKDHGSWEDIPAGSAGYTWEGISCLDHTFEVRVTDGGGLSDADTCIFDGPDEAPQVGITNCPSSTGSSYEFNWDMSDDCTDYSLLEIEIKLDGSPWQPIPPGSSSYTWDGISSCSDHIFEVRVTDGIGQSDTDTCNFAGPDDPPEVSIINCVDVICEDHYLFEWDLSDDCTPDEQLLISVKEDDGSWIDKADGTTSVEWISIDEGDHTLRVRAIDGAGNETVESCEFRCDQSAPEISFLYPDTSYSAPCISANDSHLSYDELTGEFTYVVSASAADPAGFNFVRLDVGDYSETKYPSGTDVIEDFDWTFEIKDAEVGYKWHLTLTAEDTCGRSSQTEKEIFTIFMPGWPSGTSGVPACGDNYKYWDDGWFMVGATNETYCSAAQDDPYSVSVSNFDGDTPGQAGWRFRISDEEWGDPIDITELRIEGSTCCLGDCDAYEWELGILNFSTLDYEWIEAGPPMEGCMIWNWPRVPDWYYFLHASSKQNIYLAIRVDNGEVTSDGVTDFFIGVYLER